MTELIPGNTFAVVLPPAAPTILPVSPFESDQVVVPVPGPAGPPGSGTTLYEYVQVTPAASWLIESPSGRAPAGLMVLVNNQEVIADVEYHPTLPRVTITFASPTAGRALYL